MIRIPKRHLSTLNIVKTGILGQSKAFDNIYDKLGKEKVKKLLQYNIGVKELNAEDNKKKSVLDDMDRFYVGGWDQYSSAAHSNIAKVSQALITLQSIDSWMCSRETKQTLGIPITSPIHYHPFKITFPSKSDRKKKRTGGSLWKRIPNDDYSDLRDSWGNNMPLLSRSLQKGHSQQLLLFRDTHPDMANIGRMERIVEEVHFPMISFADFLNSVVNEYPVQANLYCH